MKVEPYIFISRCTPLKDQTRIEWTSQFYPNNSITEQVHTQPPYSDHGQPEMTNEEDGIYMGPSSDGLTQSNAGERLMLNMTSDEEVQGYIATFNVVVNANQTG
jgi:hypothetical protein